MINHIEVASRSRENVTHTLYMDEAGKAIGCTCEHRQYQAWVPCSHMSEWNQRALLGEDLAPHVEDDLRGSCCLCGGYTKQIICGRCLE